MDNIIITIKKKKLTKVGTKVLIHNKKVATVNTQIDMGWLCLYKPEHCANLYI